MYTYYDYPLYQVNYGWICPKCSRSINPDIQVCACCGSFTTTSFITTNQEIYEN